MQIIERTLAAVPDDQVFLSVDELDASSKQLAAEFSHLVQLSVAGHSGAGHPILQLRIGTGRRRALLFGCPHPNEPVGAMMLEYLSRRLCEDAELREAYDYTWYIIKCIDVDGTRLNEGWFKGPFTPAHYARHFYRPAFHQQVEWTFPIRYKTYTFERPLPETQALMQTIREARPDFICSLHNSGFGGAFYYLSRQLPEELHTALIELIRRNGLPLHQGEPEVPFAEQLSPGVYRLPGIKDMYEFYRQQSGGADPAGMLNAGASSHEFAEQLCDPVTLVAEVPYYCDPRINDTTPTAAIRRDILLEGIERDEEILSFLRRQYEQAGDHLAVPTPFEEALADFLRQASQAAAAKRRWAQTDASLARPATVAEMFDTRVQAVFYHLLYFGMFLRMLEAQPDQASLAGIRQAVDAEMQRWTDYLEQYLQHSLAPIRNLVSVQLGAALQVMGKI